MFETKRRAFVEPDEVWNMKDDEKVLVNKLTLWRRIGDLAGYRAVPTSEDIADAKLLIRVKKSLSF